MRVIPASLQSEALTNWTQGLQVHALAWANWQLTLKLFTRVWAFHFKPNIKEVQLRAVATSSNMWPITCNLAPSATCLCVSGRVRLMAALQGYATSNTAPKTSDHHDDDQQDDIAL